MCNTSSYRRGVQGTTSLPSPPPGSDLPQKTGRRQLTPDELHKQRKEWGKKWGAMVKQATQGIGKGE